MSKIGERRQGVVVRYCPQGARVISKLPAITENCGVRLEFFGYSHCPCSGLRQLDEATAICPLVDQIAQIYEFTFGPAL
jgi:hypothetical protein